MRISDQVSMCCVAESGKRQRAGSGKVSRCHHCCCGLSRQRKSHVSGRLFAFSGYRQQSCILFLETPPALFREVVPNEKTFFTDVSRRSSTGFLCSSTATPTARTSTFAHPGSIVSPRATISASPRLQGSCPTASNHVLLSRPAPATFQVWLKHPKMFPKLLGTFAAQTLAER
jgi:hypothetical protein